MRPTWPRSGAPVGVVFNLVSKFLGAGARQFGFMLRGIREMQALLEARGIQFILLEGDPAECLPEFVEKSGASLLVADVSPLRLSRLWKEEFADKINIPFHMSEQVAIDRSGTHGVRVRKRNKRVLRVCVFEQFVQDE